MVWLFLKDCRKPLKYLMTHNCYSYTMRLKIRFTKLFFSPNCKLDIFILIDFSGEIMSEMYFFPSFCSSLFSELSNKMYYLYKGKQLGE